MKRSIRDYLLTLVLAILVFAVAAFFLIRAGETLMGDVVEKIGSDEPVTVPENEEPQQCVFAGIITILVETLWIVTSGLITEILRVTLNIRTCHVGSIEQTVTEDFVLGSVSP